MRDGFPPQSKLLRPTTRVALRVTHRLLLDSYLPRQTAAICGPTKQHNIRSLHLCGGDFVAVSFYGFSLALQSPPQRGWKESRIKDGMLPNEDPYVGGRAGGRAATSAEQTGMNQR